MPPEHASRLPWRSSLISRAILLSALILIVVSLVNRAEFPSFLLAQDQPRPSATPTIRQSEDLGIPSTKLKTPSATTPDANSAGSDSRPGMIRSLRDVARSMDVLNEADQESGLFRDLDNVADQFEEMKLSNKEALRQANRQFRPGSNAASPNVVLIQIERFPMHLEKDAVAEDQANPVSIGLDEIRSQSLSFLSCYSASNDLNRAQWSVLTGRNPSLATTSAAPLTLQGNRLLLPKLLWKGGYKTAFIGQWDDPQLPMQHGYEEWVGFRTRKESQSFPEMVSIDTTEMRLAENQKGGQGLHALDLFLSESTHFMMRHHRGRPFFLHIVLPALPASPTSRDASDDIQRQFAVVSRLIESLQQLGLTSRTCIILTGISGAASASSSSTPLITTPPQTVRQRLTQQGLSEQNLRVPMFMIWPGKITPGTTTHLCAAWDLLPTLLDLTGTQFRPGHPEGLSFAPLLRKKPQTEHRLLFWATPDRSIQVVRQVDWKGIHFRGETRVKLFDLKSDPDETKDVASQHPDVVQQLIAK